MCATALLMAAVVQPGAVVSEFNAAESEDALWKILQANAPNDYVAAGILGFFWRESVYKSDCVAHWATDMAYAGEDPGAEFTEKLDSADKDEFVAMIRAEGGYGLGQWYSRKHLESLYDFCKEYGSSFSDARMQCLFTIHGCVDDPDVWNYLKDAKNAHDAGHIIAYLYDGTKSGSGTIAARAALIYKERVKKRLG